MIWPLFSCWYLIDGVKLFNFWLERNNPEPKDNQELAMLVIHKTAKNKVLSDNW